MKKKRKRKKDVNSKNEGQIQDEKRDRSITENMIKARKKRERKNRTKNESGKSTNLERKKEKQ